MWGVTSSWALSPERTQDTQPSDVVIIYISDFICRLSQCQCHSQRFSSQHCQCHNLQTVISCKPGHRRDSMFL